MSSLPCVVSASDDRLWLVRGSVDSEVLPADDFRLYKGGKALLQSYGRWNMAIEVLDSGSFMDGQARVSTHTTGLETIHRGKTLSAAIKGRLIT